LNFAQARVAESCARSFAAGGFLEPDLGYGWAAREMRSVLFCSNGVGPSAFRAVPAGVGSEVWQKA